MTNRDPGPVPLWLTDKEAIAPCPCGRGYGGPMVLVQGQSELFYFYHPQCFKELMSNSDEAPDFDDDLPDWE